jgi:hypothetical protein
MTSIFKVSAYGLPAWAVHHIIHILRGMSSDLDTTFPFLKSLDIPPAWEAAAQPFPEIRRRHPGPGRPGHGQEHPVPVSDLPGLCRRGNRGPGGPGFGAIPPGTPRRPGLGLFPPRLPGDQGLFPEGLYFIGQTSPVGRVLEVAVGCRVLADRARAQGASRVVVNTSGSDQRPGRVPAQTGGSGTFAARPDPGPGPGAGTFPLAPGPGRGAPTLLLPVSAQGHAPGYGRAPPLSPNPLPPLFCQGPAPCPVVIRSGLAGAAPGLGRALAPGGTAPLQRRLERTPVLYGVAGDSRVTLVIDGPPPPLAAPESLEGLHLLSRSALDHSLTGLLDASRRTLALAVLLPSPWQEGPFAPLDPPVRPPRLPRSDI